MSNFEKRAATDVKAVGKKLTGYVATFGLETRIGDFSEVIQVGAFGASLRSNPDILALVDHDPGKVLGRSASGSLILEEDQKGLRFELDLPDTQLGRDIASLAARHDIGGMSFGFNVPEGGDEWHGEKRTLKAIGHYRRCDLQQHWRGKSRPCDPSPCALGQAYRKRLQHNAAFA